MFPRFFNAATWLQQMAGHDIPAKSDGKEPEPFSSRLIANPHLRRGHHSRISSLNPSQGVIMRIAILLSILTAGLSNPAAAMPRYVGVELVKSDPQGASPLLTAFSWLQGTLLGNAATAAAVMVVAIVGFLMLRRWHTFPG